jgi:hypothetical protein
VKVFLNYIWTIILDFTYIGQKEDFSPPAHVSWLADPNIVILLVGESINKFGVFIRKNVGQWSKGKHFSENSLIFLNARLPSFFSLLDIENL